VYDADPDLIAACIGGEPEAWLAFKERYQRLIRATIARTTAVDDATVEDLESMVYQKLLEDRCRRMRAWRGRARFSTYLVQITRNLVLDWVDQQKRRIVTTSLEENGYSVGIAPDYGAEEETAEQVKALHAALRALPPKQAMILRLRIEGKSLREIARLLGRPVGTVSVENSRAMHRMRVLLEQSGLFPAGTHP
jgi:RNA polymerase sigma-70 factor (ECF subfamily)